MIAVAGPPVVAIGSNNKPAVIASDSEDLQLQQQLEQMDELFNNSRVVGTAPNDRLSLGHQILNVGETQEIRKLNPQQFCVDSSIIKPLDT